MAICPSCDITLTSTAEESMQYLKNPNIPVDSAFIDIRLESSSGIELATEISKLYPNIRIVFVTGFGNEYYEDIFLSVKPFAILKKPIKQDYLESHLKKLEDDLSLEAKLLQFRFNGISFEIPLRGILYVVSDKRKIHIHSADAVYDTYEKLDDLQKRLGKSFVRCQKSYAINLDYVYKMDENFFELNNHTKINISKPYRKSAKEAYFKHHFTVSETNQIVETEKAT